MTEAEAITLLKQGDIHGLETLVHLYSLEAVRVAYLVCRHRPTAEDAAQSAFLLAYERIHTFDNTRPFKPWLMRCAVNAALKLANRSSREQSYPDTIEPDEDSWQSSQSDDLPLPDELLSNTETRAEIWQTLGQLTPTQRAVIVQRYYLDMTELEMSQTLNIAPGTVKSRLNSARNRLRRLLPAWVRPTDD